MMQEAKARTGKIYLEALFCRKAEFEQAGFSATEAATPRVLSGYYPNQFEVKYYDRAKEILDVELSLSIKPEEAGLPYRVLVSMVGRFRIDSLPQGLDLTGFKQKNAPAILYPYLREVVASLTSRGSYGPVFLPTVNFAAGTLEEQGEQEQDVMK